MSTTVQRNPRILVIDDNPSIHDDFRKILRGSQASNSALESAEAELFGEAVSATGPSISFEVDSALQGREGLERVQQAIAAGRPYAMAFVDMRMPPGWDGVETIEKIWAVYPDLQVVICTAYSDYSWDQMIARLGQSDRLVVLKKPFDPIEALQLATALSEKWRLLRQTRAQVGELEERVRLRTQELERAMTDFKSARDAAESALRVKGMFLASMSHELRTPMNGVIGMAELLLSSELSPDQHESAETIRDSASKLLVILNDILDFSKIEANKLTFDLHEFDLRTVVEATLDLLAPRAHTKGIELVSVIITPDVPLQLRGDSGRLRQIVANLVGNAIKFTAHGEVTLRVTLESATATHARLRFEISDTGIGIPEQAQGGLFQAFTQADGSTTRRFGGTGLGLAICKQLVTLMQGDIGLRSSPEKGSTFWFTAEFELQTISPTTRVEPSPRFGTLHVLAVDSNAVSNRVLCDEMRSLRITAAGAPSGQAAIEALRSANAAGWPFHCVLIDLQLCDGPGLALARSIKADPALKQARLIGLTRAGQILAHEQLAQAGIEMHIAKPIRQCRLLECLERVAGELPSHTPVASAEPFVDNEPPFVPRASAAPAAPATQVAQAIAAGPPDVRILLVEDNEVNQKVALRQLRKLGHDAHCAGNGLEAMAALEKRRYDFVLMDCQMPEMDGFEATREIRRREEAARAAGTPIAPIHIVALTANAMQGDRERCLEAGMNGYLAKPAQLADLKRAVEDGLAVPVQNACALPPAALNENTAR